jgi:hypothetical protein
MKEDERWDEDGAPAEVSALLRAGRAEVPRKRVVHAALVAAGSVALAGKSSAALSLVSVLKWGVSGLALGSLVSVGSVALRPAAGLPSASASAARTPAPKANAAARVLAEAVPSPPPAPPISSPVRVQPFLPQVSARAAAPSASGPNDSGTRLEQELALVDSIRAAIDAREFARALSLLDAHERRFGNAAPLAPEARYLRMEALRLGGRMDAAREVAQRILSGDANGPHRERAKAVLDAPVTQHFVPETGALDALPRQ